MSHRWEVFCLKNNYDYRDFLHKLLSKLVENEASDLHINANHYVHYRIHGDMFPTELKLSGEEIFSLAINALNKWQQSEYLKSKSIDFGYSFDSFRFRGNMCYVSGHHSVVFRKMDETIRPFNELGLPPILKDILYEPNGLVLVTGATGSGKTTSMASMIDFINENRRIHITTIENPIEYIHADKKSLVTQREVGEDSPSFYDCLKDALRRDPDSIVVGEMRDPQTVATAIEASSTGHLVFGTLHTNNAPSTINRILNLYNGDERDLIRANLAEDLKAILSQRLVKTKDGKGRVPVFELLIPNDNIRNMIYEGDTKSIYSEMRNAKDIGNIIMSDYYKDLKAKNII